MGAGTGRHRLFVGTYTRGASRGIYSVVLDAATGELGAPELAAEAPNPTFLALSPGRDLLYAVCAGPAWASSFRIDPASPRLAPVQQRPPGDGPTPCHIAVDGGGRIALAANYHLGLAAAIPLNPDGTLGTPRVVAHTGRGPHPTRQTASHVHSANFSPDSRFALVCDLGLDRIYTYAIDRGPVALRPGQPALRRLSSRRRAPPPGVRADGPARLRDQRAREHDRRLRPMTPRAGASPRGQTVSVLPERVTRATQRRPRSRSTRAAGSSTARAAARTPSPSFRLDGATGELSPVETVPCGGKGPQAFLDLARRRVARLRAPGFRHALLVPRRRRHGPPAPDPRVGLRSDAGVRPVPWLSRALRRR